MRACFRNIHDSAATGFRSMYAQVASSDSFEDGRALEPFLEERTADFVLSVGLQAVFDPFPPVDRAFNEQARASNTGA